MTQSVLANPSVFGPSGAGAAEVGRLDATLARVGQLCHALEVGREDIEPARVLSELRGDLVLHFAREEGDEHFGAVVRERPSLAHSIADLKAEHLELLERLDAIRDKASAVASRRELEAPTVRLLEALHAHEQKEGEVLQELVLRDDGIGPD